MSHHIFYNNIRNHIASELFKNPEYLFEIEDKIEFSKDGETIFTFCSEAARMFYTVLNLSELYKSPNITSALDRYTLIIFNQLTKGEKIPNIDLILTAAETLRQFC